MSEVLVQSVFERDKLSHIVENFGAHDHQWEPKIISLADASRDLTAALLRVGVPQT